MGRKKVELKRIEDKSSRQVTFSKRRNGLIKKARELSVLCDVDVALLIFSTRGKLFHFSAQSNLDEIIKRYRRQYEDYESIDIGRAECADSLSYSEILKIVQRCLGDLEQLSVSDLGQLEKQIRTALTQTRSRKTDIMMELLISLQEQEKLMETEREQLLKEIEKSEEANNNRNGLVKENIGYEVNDMSSETQLPTLSLLHL